MPMGYPLTFRPNVQINIFSPAGVFLAGPFDAQVFKPLIATSMNTYTSGGSTIWSPGATILRLVVALNWTVYDVPGAAGRYFTFVGDPVPKKWRVVSAFTWGPAVGATNRTHVLLGEFI